MATTATAKPTAKTPTKKRSQRRSVPKVADSSQRRDAIDALTPAGVVLREVPLDLIDPNPANPRQALGDLEELAASIKDKGVLQAVTLVPVSVDGAVRYQPIAGHRRCAAARLAGIDTVPAQVRDGLSEADQLEVMVVENVHRADLTPFEEGHAMQGLLDLGRTKTQIHERTGRARTTIDRRLSLAQLDERVEAKVATNALTLEEAYELADIQARDAKVYTDLVAHLDSGDLAAWRIRDAYNRIDAREKGKKLRADLKAKGIPITKTRPTYYLAQDAKCVELPSLGLKAAAHKGCPGHAAYLSEDSYNGRTSKTWCCVDVPTHHADVIESMRNGDRPGMSPAENARREARLQLGRDLAGAQQSRDTWLLATLSTMGSDRREVRLKLVDLAAKLALESKYPATFNLNVELPEEFHGPGAAWPWEPTARLTAMVLMGNTPIPIRSHEYEYVANTEFRYARDLVVQMLDGLADAGYTLTPFEVSMREAFNTAPAVDEGGEAA